MARYRSVPITVGLDPRLDSVSGVAVAIWHALWHAPDSHVSGIWRTSVEEIADQVRFPADACRDAMGALDEAGLIAWCPRRRIVWVPTATGVWLQPGGKAAMGVPGYLETLPQCQVVADYWRSLCASHSEARCPAWAADYAARDAGIQDAPQEPAANIPAPVDRVRDTPPDTLPSTLPDRVSRQETGSVNSKQEIGGLGGPPVGAPQLAIVESSSPAARGSPRKRRRNTIDPSIRESACRVLSALSEARRAISATCRELRPTDTNLRHIAARLAEGEPEETLLAVIAARRRECERSPRLLCYLNASTPFRDQNWPRSTAQIDQADADVRALAASQGLAEDVAPGVHKL